ncbi:MAG TPA: efflux RND transporter periplasmic adaptor subunit [Burkholderiales bacterium]|jgi:multidrug efflux system membrane fusion protein|nr:efflux RND transporter periplasmic adaptor subunit [Burkholderiales bacterium]
MSSRTRFAVAAGIALVVTLGAVLAYFSVDSGAKEKKRPKGEAEVPVSVIAAAQQSVPVTVQAIGNVEPLASVAVKARVDGQIVAVNFKEGQEVRKGEVLFRLDSRPFEAALKQAEANVLRDAAARDQARSQERRYKELLEKNFVSKEAYAQIATNAQTAEATAKASQAALESARVSLDYCTIASPIDGFVGKVLLQIGNMVKANDTISLVVINQVRPIYVSFSVPEQQLTEVRRLQQSGPLEVAVSTSDNRHAPLAKGQLAFIDNAVDPSTGTIKLRATFDNRDLALWPGQYVTTELKLYEQKDAIVVPAAAVQTGPQGEYVFVMKPDATAEVRKIEVARTNGDQVVIGKGLATGEKVVTRGQLRISPGAKLRVQAGA